MFDLQNHYHGQDIIVTRNVKPRWAAALAMGITDQTWDEMMAHGRVKILRDLHWPEGAGRA